MPATEEAAAVTDAYRARLLRLREATVRLVARPFDAIDFGRQLSAELDDWIDQAAPTLDLAQREAVRMTDTYFDVYLQRSGVEAASDPVDVDELTVSERELRRRLHVVKVALLWRLGRAGRVAAQAYGLSEAMRVTRNTVAETAHSTLGERMVNDRQIAGWKRVSGLNACGACLALADGRVQRADTPMRRHGHCRCSQEPVIRNVPQRFVRPTGVQIYRRMSATEKAQLFAGRGGAQKAAVVDRRGLGCLVHSTGDGVEEATLAAIA